MKKLLPVVLILISGCITPRYVYIVDDVYHGRPAFRPTNNIASPRTRFNTIELPPYNSWRRYPNQRRPQTSIPKLYIAPRRENLGSFNPQLPPPPPPPEKKEEVKEEVKKQAPIRRFDNLKK